MTNSFSAPSSDQIGSRVFAIVPAAGRSSRMGAPKLLLPWHHGTIIDHVLKAWLDSNVDHVIVVLRNDDDAMRQACLRWSVELVCPEIPPVDMKASIQCGLRHIQSTHEPTAADRWIVAPADLPALNAELINRVVNAGKNRNTVVAPRFGGRQGHPVLFPWVLADETFLLAKDEGIDRLLTINDVFHLELSAEERIEDVDEPDDYLRVRSRLVSEQSAFQDNSDRCDPL